jgi:purine nucleosidase
MTRYRAALALLCAGVVGFIAVNGKLWFTGRPDVVPLTLVTGGAGVAPPGRIWIDTDAACGATLRTDPDDCFAIVWLVAQGANVIGISTSFGNAPGDVVATTVHHLADVMAVQGPRPPPVFIGHAGPAMDNTPIPPGVAALQAALGEGPLTILALGPLTNIAAALQGRRDLQAQVAQVVAVMGHRPGHVFHPTEGGGHGAIWGHGPIFRDLNVAVDVDAVRAVLVMGLPMTLIPYDAATGTLISGADLDGLAAQGAAMAYVSRTARGWLGFWNDDVGLSGFYPFDWVAAGYLRHPASFDCAVVRAQIVREWTFWLLPRDGLVVDALGEADASAVIYCPQAVPALHDLLISAP